MRNTIRDLFVDELKEMLSTEKQIVEALPTMIKAADSAKLKEAFTSHWKESKGHVSRLEKIFKLLKLTDKEQLCRATKGLIQESADIIKEFEKSALRDAALISKAQRIEHFEIAAYGTLRAFAKELGEDEAANLLQETLDEEAHADKKLTKIAEGGFLSVGINQRANKPVEEKAVKKPVVTIPKKTEVKKAIKNTAAKTATAISKKTKTVASKAKATAASAKKTVKKTAKAGAKKAKHLVAHH